MPIVKLLEFRKGKQMGIYVISPQEPTDKEIGFKIGRTIQMDKRLNDYHLCYNHGFYIYRALMLNDTYGRRSKAEKQAAIDMTTKIEKHVHDLLKHINVKTPTRKYKSEWFLDSSKLEVIDKALIATHKKFEKETDYPLLGFYKPFYNKFFIDGMEEVVLTEKPPSYLPKEGQKTRSGRTVKVSSKLKDSLFFK